jgi:hypothetical protein
VVSVLPILVASVMFLGDGIAARGDSEMQVAAEDSEDDENE